MPSRLVVTSLLLSSLVWASGRAARPDSALRPEPAAARAGEPTHPHVGWPSGVPKVIRLTYKTVAEIPAEVIADVKAMYPDFEVKVYGDAECTAFLRANYSEAAATLFTRIPFGAIKADFFRAAVLQKLGGMYFDLDLDHRAAVTDVVRSDADLVTSHSLESMFMNPIVLIARPEDPTLKKVVDAYLSKGANSSEPFCYWSWSICPMLYAVLDSELDSLSQRRTWYEAGGRRYQFLTESAPVGGDWGRRTVDAWSNRELFKNQVPRYNITEQEAAKKRDPTKYECRPTSPAAADASIVFSASIYTCLDCARDLVDNALAFSGTGAVVVHWNARMEAAERRLAAREPPTLQHGRQAELTPPRRNGSLRWVVHDALLSMDESDAALAEFTRSYDGQPRVSFNPERHLVSRVGASLLRAHLSNFEHAMNALSPFGSFLFLSSNMLLVKPPYPLVSTGEGPPPHHPSPTDYFLSVVEADPVLRRLRGSANSTSPLKMISDGAWFQRTVFEPFAQLVAPELDRLITSGDELNYCYEEFWPANLVKWQPSSASANRDPTLIKWETNPNLTVTIDDVRDCQAQESCYAVKRIEMRLDDPVREFVRSQRPSGAAP